MIKIKFIFKQHQKKLELFLIYFKYFSKKFNVLIDEENPDIIICDSITDYINKYDKPIIICERIDCCNTWKRDIIIKDNIIAVFKEYIPRPLNLLNKSMVRGRIHFRMICESFNLDPKNEYKEYKDNEKIDIKYLNKLKCVNWNWSQYTHLSNKYHMKYFRENSKQIFNLQKKDIIFAVFRQHISSWDGYSRKKCIEILKQSKYKTITITKKQDEKKYIDILSQSKICISPWGYGERIALDFYAMYCGAILIKPNTDFVTAFPDIYQSNKYYVACKWDYSDVEEKIKDILKNYEKYNYMRKNAKKILDKCNHETLIKHFCNTIHNLF